MSLPSPLRPSRVLERLGSSRFARDLRILGIVPSTSDLVLSSAKNDAVDGLVIAAEGQRAGRGRRGTSWESPVRRGIYVSFLLRPAPKDSVLPLLAPALGLATALAIEDLGLESALKWPNDVLVAGKKVAGCVIDLVQEQGTLPAAVAGIGINANFTHNDLVTDGAIRAGSLALMLGRNVDREMLLAGLLLHTEAVLSDLESSREERVIAAFRARDALRGAFVVAREGDRVFEGEVVEADPRAGLLLQTGVGPIRLRPEHTHILLAKLKDPS